MPLSSATGYTDYVAASQNSPYQVWGNRTTSSGANSLMTSWRLPASSGSTAGNVVCASTSLGSLWMSTAFPTPTSTNLWLTEIEAHSSTLAVTAMAAILIDRLVQTDGAVMNVATTQTINSTALTRSTNGIGNMIAVQVWTTTAMAGTLLTVKYTNTAGTTGRAAPTIPITAGVTNRMFIVPLAAGDLGVKAVEEIQFASSAAAAGNVGVVIFRPLAVFPMGANVNWAETEPYRNMMVGGGFAMSSLMSSACLDMITITQGVSNYDLQYRMSFIEQA